MMIGRAFLPTTRLAAYFQSLSWLEMGRWMIARRSPAAPEQLICINDCCKHSTKIDEAILKLIAKSSEQKGRWIVALLPMEVLEDELGQSEKAKTCFLKELLWKTR